MKKQYVSYIRVSTDEQGHSGLGLSAQRQSIKDYINGGAELIKEFKEVESGTKERPELQAAIEYCKEHGATLVASKIDRLARSLFLFEKIKQTGIDFEIVGLPKNPLVQQVLASVAEWEARAISERTKAALAVKKSQGVLLGYDRPEVKAGVTKYWEKRKAEQKPVAKKECRSKAAMQARDSKSLSIIQAFQRAGLSYSQIAVELNKCVPTPRNGKWSKQQVARVIKRNQKPLKKAA